MEENNVGQWYKIHNAAVSVECRLTLRDDSEQHVWLECVHIHHVVMYSAHSLCCFLFHFENWPKENRRRWQRNHVTELSWEQKSHTGSDMYKHSEWSKRKSREICLTDRKRRRVSRELARSETYFMLFRCLYKITQCTHGKAT